MSQPSSPTLLSTDVNFAALLEEPPEAITEADLALDEDAWRALLIQIDQAEDSG